ncbi:MAG: rod shape-determining protein MreC [Lactobacillus helsingborgensis]|uniref:rod shape-determining protein MreC n=1 Tax=Lactobacillus TaxID=1578 RepID=UPI000D6FF48F|nr:MULTISPECIES: rod shape-determining protein MreC [Lactobacillus]AWN33345.1 rod shape-determining protein MreC [Lactobacillus helsingborgensis]MCT6812689.1 rod shape-determining protein MreC [Lactobacillus helsingborgensis]MCT6827603.1 rod shape-determining protein MreC [Lactobacillus helsingborgensis]MCT6846623.1 rod shape-determining protein MreC [Lactobacillus helsingborgensis]RMC53809.1 rod shape-determining protein MreC [Lactobacillus sp. ESL0262]
MKKFLQNKKLLSACIIVVLIFAILGGSVSMRNKRNTPMIIQSFGNDVVAVGARIIDFPLSFVSGSLNNVHDLMNTQNENNYLKSKVTDLEQTKTRNATLEAENKQLKSALKLKESLTDYEKIQASVISRSPDSWSDLLIINKGTTAGLRKNMAVMSGGGVIGRVVEVNAASAKVELITTSDKSANRFAVEAQAVNGKKVHGIITVIGNNTLAFTQAVDGKKLKRGTKIYTSGMGGNSPKGLLVGTIATTTHDTFGLSDLVKITPAGELNDPSVVTIIKRKVDD